MAEWLANGRRLAREPREDMRLADIVTAYLEFAERYYSDPDGKPTREVENIALPVCRLLGFYGALPVHEFVLRQVKRHSGPQTEVAGLAWVCRHAPRVPDA